MNYFWMNPQFNRSGLGLENMNALFERPGVYRKGRIAMPHGALPRGVPDLPEPPILTFDRKAGPPPDDIETFGPWWAVSDRFKCFAEDLDLEAFEFAACDNTKLTVAGEEATYWLCDAKRYGSYVDEALSSNFKVIVEASGRKHYWMLPKHSKLAMKSEEVGSARAFGIPESNAVFCDAYFREAFESAGLRLRYFDPV